MKRVTPWLVALAVLQLFLARPVIAETSEARAHFDKATSAFALGKFADAATEYEKAFELKPDAALLYNAAQSHRLAGNKQRALLLYQNYLRIYGKQANNKAEVNRNIVELKAAIETEGVAGTPPTPREKPVEPVPVVAPVVAPTVVTPTTDASLVATPPRDKPLVKKGWFWGALVGGVVVVGGAVALGVVFGSKKHDPSPSLGNVQVSN